MMVNTSNNWLAMTDDAIVEQIGFFLKKNRIAKNKTQSQIAASAGVNRWTISKIENGEAITLSKLIQILRALDMLYVLDSFASSTEMSPLEAVKLKKKERQRASKTSKRDQPKSDW